MLFYKKKIYIFLFIILLFLLLIYSLSFGHVFDKKEIDYGITFSKQQAIDLGLDWQKVLENGLDDLEIKNWRLSAYWDEIEKNKDEFDWTDTDWQINKVSEKNGKIILALGGRLPRWPECHFPEWSKNLPTPELEQKQLDYIEEVVLRYKDNKNIFAWQVENEPFLKFGRCPNLNVEFLDKEIALVRSLDSRPVVVTDSGELSIWIRAADRADIFGTTMYRDTFSEHLNSYIHYPIRPGFFHFKKKMASLFAGPQEWIVIELQAEPWGPRPFQELSKGERDRTMSEKKFTEMMEFARLTGFKTFYLWGIEWWYWEKEKQNNPFFINEAKKLYLKENYVKY